MNKTKDETGNRLRRIGNIALSTTLILILFVLFFSFLTRGHLASRSFKIFCIIEMIASFGVLLAFPKWRYALFSFSIVVAPRVSSIVMGRETHSILSPVMIGFSVALLLLTIKEEQRNFKSTAPQRKQERFLFLYEPINLIYMFVVSLTVFAFIKWYDPATLMQGIVQDRHVGYGVSANYAYYLSSLLSLNLIAPLTLVMVDFEYRKSFYRNMQATEIKDRIGLCNNRIAFSLVEGLTLAALVNIIAGWLQVADVNRLWIGLLSSWKLGRVSMLLTDSGASSTMIFWLFSSIVFMLLSLKETLTYKENSLRIEVSSLSLILEAPVIKRVLVSVWRDPRRKYTALTLVALMFATMLPLIVKQGATLVLSFASLMIVVITVYMFRTRYKLKMQNDKRFVKRSIALASLMLVALIGIGSIIKIPPSYVSSFLFLQKSSNALQALQGKSSQSYRSPMELYHIVDRSRAYQTLIAFALFREHPTVGHGLNSYMTAGSRYKIEQPDSKILFEEFPFLSADYKYVIDNPPGLIAALMSDVGWLGSLIVFLLLLLAFLQVKGNLNVQHSNRETTPYATLYIVLTPLFFLFPFLIGFHLIFAEMGAAIIFVLFLGGASCYQDRRNATMQIKALSWMSLILIIVYLVLFGVQ